MLLYVNNMAQCIDSGGNDGEMRKQVNVDRLDSKIDKARDLPSAISKCGID
jgi:hypothetical protein